MLFSYTFSKKQNMHKYLCIVLIYSLFKISNSSVQHYHQYKQNIILNEYSKIPGSQIKLSKEEVRVNNLLLKFKSEEYEIGLKDPSKFLPSQHFFKVKHEIEKSKVFNFIRMLPKGGSLHSHFTATLSLDRFINLIYNNSLYCCQDNGSFRIQYFPGKINNDCKWKNVDELKENSDFKFKLKDSMSLFEENPDLNKDINTIWTKFEETFTFRKSIFKSKKILQDYMWAVLEEFYNDNVMYLEIRMGSRKCIDKNKVFYGSLQTMSFLINVIKKFKESHPYFIGVRFIFTAARYHKTIKQNIEAFFELQKYYSDYVVGFDLVGQEDVGFHLSDYINDLSNMSNKTNFFFHAGETNWYGNEVDYNLIDAVWLKTKRIGHGFSIVKHPKILEIIKKENIAIEVNPLSNQVLNLVHDMRNHVGSILVAGGYPMVITCDDPGLWEAKGLSYDWYMAFMAMTPQKGDLKILKQWALNSIYYSALKEGEKKEGLDIFHERWKHFITNITNAFLLDQK